MIRVLHEVANLDGGGVARLLYDYYTWMDREKVHFDFLIYSYFEKGILEDPLKEMGSAIYKITKAEENQKKRLQEMDEVIRNGHYDVVHTHLGPQGYYALSSAKRHGVPVRVVHSHLAYRSPSVVRRVKNRILLQADQLLATELFACGRDAGTAMWGTRKMKGGKVHIMTNAVNQEKFRFSPEKRAQKRRELHVEDRFVLGTVGRLEEQKNYPFLLAVFREVLKQEPKAVLVVAGRGSQEEKIRHLAQEMGILEQVQFLGVRSDVHELLNAFDVFVLPSLFEGLPVVLVEAQANGVPEVVADTITDEMAVTDLITYLPLGDAEAWSRSILACKAQNREAYADMVGSSGYGIQTQAKKMEAFYAEGVWHG